MKRTIGCSALAFAALLAVSGCGPRNTGNGDDGGGNNQNSNDGGVQNDAEVCDPGNAVCDGVCCEAGEYCWANLCCDDDRRCGENCCGADELCMGGHCYPDCGAGTLCLDENDQELCCGASEICFMNQCLVPGAWCDSNADCALTDYCELSINACLPIPDSPCQYIPPAGEFLPTTEWTWPPAGGSAVQPDYVDVLTAPAVGDMDGDGIPEVVFVGYRDACVGGSYNTGILTIVRGDTGAEILRHDDPARRLQSSTAPALGDIDGDGLPEVVVGGINGLLYAYEMDGTLIWESEHATREMAYGALAIADVDNDGSPNIVFGPTIYDHQGHFMCSGVGGVGGSSATRAISVVADLDMDGDMEIVGGNTAYHHDCTTYWQNTSIGDGYPGIGDIFDATGMPGQDLWPEVALVQGGNVYVLNGQTGDVIWGPVPIPGNTGSNFGGAPVVADFDGDGYREIGTAGGGAMAVFDPDGPTPVLWDSPTKDTSSAITGCTVFDFEGDGSAEIVYTDECFVYIYKGTDGTILFQESNNTRTHNEFPIVVDVDADGNSELVVTANSCNWNCETMAGWTGPIRRGIKVYGDTLLNWVRTRKIWNQHSYHVTNVNDDGTIPSPEPSNWLTSGLNNYRQNVQTEGVHNAPNMVGTNFGADTRLCAVGGSLALGLMVENEGSKGVPAGLHVGFYRIYNGTDASFIGSVQTVDPILPGMIEYVELLYDIPAADNPLPDEFWFSAVVDDASIMEVAIHECHEDDNTVGPISVSCTTVN